MIKIANYYIRSQRTVTVQWTDVRIKELSLKYTLQSHGTSLISHMMVTFWRSTLNLRNFHSRGKRDKCVNAVGMLHERRLDDWV